MDKDKGLTFGARLKDLRLEKNLTLNEVHKKTKIPINILEAIEEDRIVGIGPVYVRGFLKIYCTLLGVDYREYTPASYKSEIPQESLKKDKAIISPPKVEVSFFDRQKVKMKIGITFFLVFIFIFAIFKLAHIKRPVTRQKKTKTEVGSALAIAPFATIKLGIRAKEDCWLKAVVDGKVVFQNILKKGRFETWEADERIELSLGNAGGIELEVNGRLFSPLGRRGQVVKRILINKEGLQVLR
jgi:transcriptional regulator with XRE-family HTH domain